MVRLPGGRFIAGSDRHYPEEAPPRPAEVRPFLMDRTPVTNAAFAAFVAATGYVTVAERPPDPADYPDADPARLAAGSIVFTPPAPGASSRGLGDWWRFVPGVNWQSASEAADHPVVHVAHADAVAYAAWAGKSLPTEAEWEFAALGGGGGTEFAWGDELEPGGRHMANVWEWTNDIWVPNRTGAPLKACCTTGGGIAQHVIKGGSHLCAPNYCRRYRPAARQPQAADSGTSHIGFRCVRRLDL